MKYTFHSTDPDNFNEVDGPINYLGVCKRVRWYVQERTTNHNIIVLDTTDYIVFATEGDNHTDEEYGTITWNPSKQYISITSSFIIDFNKQDVTDIQLEQTDIGTYRFKSTSGAFDITDMSYNVKQALGFYYVNDGETIKCTSFVSTTSSTDDTTTSTDNETSLLAETTTSSSSITYYIEAKAMGYTNFSPVWFLISNLGQPNQITANNDKWKLIFPAIVKNIQNTFSSETSLTWFNFDYAADSRRNTQSACVSTLRAHGQSDFWAK